MAMTYKKSLVEQLDKLLDLAKAEAMAGAQTPEAATEIREAYQTARTSFIERFIGRLS